MNSDSIRMRQNQDKMLRFQFAARTYYNRAEVLDFFIWVVCVATFITLLLPSGDTWDIITSFLAVVLDVIAAVLAWRLSVNTSRAASMRAYFDSYVLDISSYSCSKSELTQLEEWALDVTESPKSQYNVQKNHTGHDNPPGVRDWYEFAKDHDGLSAIYECQKQNFWWTEKLSRIRHIISFVLSIIVVLFLVIVAYVAFKEKDLWQILFSTAALFLKLYNRIFAHIRYGVLSRELLGATRVLENSLSLEAIQNLQKLIDNRRKLPVLESNLIHKIKAKKLSDRYIKISR